MVKVVSERLQTEKLRTAFGGTISFKKACAYQNQ